MATTSERLNEIISIRGIKQVELMEKTGISKGALSSYLSGRYVPKQDNIYKLAKALSVNPAWLMGLDVPMERTVSTNEKESSSGTKYYFSDETAAVAQEIFESQDLRALFDAARDADPKDLKMAADMLKRFKETNPDG